MRNFSNLVVLELSLCSDDHVMYSLPTLQIQELIFQKTVIPTHDLNLISHSWQEIRKLVLRGSQFSDDCLDLLAHNKIQTLQIEIFEVISSILFQKFVS